jgi:hypothetical protein
MLTINHGNQSPYMRSIGTTLTPALLCPSIGTIPHHHHRLLIGRPAHRLLRGSRSDGLLRPVHCCSLQAPAPRRRQRALAPLAPLQSAPSRASTMSLSSKSPTTTAPPTPSPSPSPHTAPSTRHSLRIVPTTSSSRTSTTNGGGTTSSAAAAGVARHEQHEQRHRGALTWWRSCPT